MTKILFCIMILLCYSCLMSNEKSEYYDNGKIKSSGSYKEGKRNGFWYMLDENSDTLNTIDYDLGDTVRIREFFNGKLFSLTEFKDKIRVKESVFYKTGIIKSSYDLLNGFPSGKYQEFYENGDLRLKTSEYGNGLHFFYDSLGFEYEIYFNDFQRIDSLTKKTGKKL